MKASTSTRIKSSAQHTKNFKKTTKRNKPLKSLKVKFEISTSLDAGALDSSWSEAGTALKIELPRSRSAPKP